MTLRVYLAGNVAIEAGGALVAERLLPGRQGRRLLAVLALERSDALPAERLAEILWDGSPPPAWPTSLRASISKLRTVLSGAGEQVSIEHALGSYQLRLPTDAWIDVEVARAAVHEAEAALGVGRLPEANGAALVAAAISRRPFLHGDGGSWVERQRTRLRDVRVRSLMVRGEVALAMGNLVDASSDAETVIELEPFEEIAYALLMRAQAAAGNRVRRWPPTTVCAPPSRRSWEPIRLATRRGSTSKSFVRPELGSGAGHLATSARGLTVEPDGRMRERTVDEGRERWRRI